MSLSSLINDRNMQTPLAPIDYKPSSFTDITKASFNATLDNYLTTSARNLEKEQVENQYKVIQDITGQPLEKLIGENAYNSDSRWKATDDFIMSMRSEDERFNNAPTTEEMRENAINKAKQSSIDLSRIKKGAGGWTGFFGDLAGGLGASVFDPVNVAVTVATLGSGALVNSGKTALQTTGRIMLTEAAIGAGTEVVMQPFIAGWQKEVGNEYGLGDAAANVAFAALASAGIAGITSSSLTKGIRSARDKGSVLFDTIASSERTPARIQPIMESMADFARVKESNPFSGVIGSKIHLDNIRIAEDAFNNRETFTPIIEGQSIRGLKGGDVPYIDSSIISGELARGDVSISNNVSDVLGDAGGRQVYIADVAQQSYKEGLVFNKKKDNVREVDLSSQKDGGGYNEWIVFKKDTQQAVFETDKKTTIDKIDTDKYEAVPKKDYIDAAKETDLDAYFKDLVNKTSAGMVFGDKPTSRKTGRAKAVPKEKIIAKELHEEELRAKDLRSRQDTQTDDVIETVQRVERNEFEDILKDDPSYKVTMEDGSTVKLSELMENIKIGEKINDAIKVCSI